MSAQEKCSRLTDRPDMTIDAHRGHKTTTQLQQHFILCAELSRLLTRALTRT